MDDVRAKIFVDGSNWYHALRAEGIKGAIDYVRLFQKICMDRTFCGATWYVGQLSSRSPNYGDQRSFLDLLEQSSPLIHVELGRIEARTASSDDCAARLRRYMADIPIRIDRDVFKDLVAMGNAYKTEPVYYLEKGVDVKLAVDLVMQAQRNEYDVAYVFSADGDFTPAIDAVRALDKDVFAVSTRAQYGSQISKAATAPIVLKRQWFDDCFHSS